MQSTLILNPAKASDPERFRAQLVDALAERGFVPSEVLLTTAEDPGAGQSHHAVDSGTEMVFVSGGDGTVMAVADALVGTEVVLALLPAGTGNLLARNFDIPRELGRAVALAADGTPRRIDVGTLDGKHFLIMAGMGFDAQMLADAPPRLKSVLGWPAYVVSGARHLLEPRRTFTLTLDGGEPVQHRGRGVLVGNVGKLQAGMPMLPDAQPDDGLLDVAVIKPRGLVSWALLAAAVVLRRKSPRLETFQARTVTVECREPLPTEIDGELLGDRDRLEISVVPGALSLMVAS